MVSQPEIRQLKDYVRHDGACETHKGRYWCGPTSLNYEFDTRPCGDSWKACLGHFRDCTCGLSTLLAGGEPLGDIASDLWRDLCDGDGEHSEALDKALILKHLRRVAGGEPTGWQPIETAPKDGTWILLWQPDNGPNIACWMDRDFPWWFIDDGKHGPYAVRGADPTHWQPVPDPPSPHTQEQAE